ncbi:hypothetical protein R1flu_003634 [Riccia fluitans]|uniref:5'-3' exonuclease domain-containing protein n=1 Tax=Riccia fluitans TaxID=41844 RepID=A0ABD1Y9J2_9MARC
MAPRCSKNLKTKEVKIPHVTISNRKKMETWGLGGLFAVDWSRTYDNLVEELVIKPKAAVPKFEYCGKPEEWTLEVWREVYNLLKASPEGYIMRGKIQFTELQLLKILNAIFALVRLEHFQHNLLAFYHHAWAAITNSYAPTPDWGEAVKKTMASDSGGQTDRAGSRRLASGSFPRSCYGSTSERRDFRVSAVAIKEPILSPRPNLDDMKAGTAPFLSIAVLGATGDLATSKIFPALFALYYSGHLPENVAIFGYSRSSLTDEDLRTLISARLTCRVDHAEECGNKTDQFLQRVFCQSGIYSTCEDMQTMDNRMLELEGGGPANRVFYLSVPSECLLEVATCLSKSAKSKTGWTRLIVEKPFGNDAESSAKITNGLYKAGFTEDQIFRYKEITIDHSGSAPHQERQSYSVTAHNMAPSNKGGSSSRTLYLVDIHPLCYDGKRPRPTAVLKWMQLLFNQVTREDPVIGVMDGEKGNDYRRQLLPGYKARRNKYKPLSGIRGPYYKRDEMDLREAFPLIRAFLSQCNVPVLKLENAEADDVVATLMHQAVKKGMRVVVASPDMDFRQLLSEDVNMLIPLPVFRRWSFYTLEQYVEQNTCDPSLDLGLRCLLGDSSDNVPGLPELAPGFGRKTALKLMKKHGSLENLLVAAKTRTVGRPYIQEALTQHADVLYRNLQVLKLRRDVDIILKDEWCRPRDRSSEAEAFQILEKNLLRKTVS